MGPIAIQVRRGAEVLGYDPENLTDQQRNMVEDALQDPAQNIFIASEYLAQLKAESEFADVPAEEMTPAQYQELAARYNGGPYWQTDDAQGYGRGFMNNLNDARNALR
jgi:soluble lytic murein transglycosylase-like protein